MHPIYRRGREANMLICGLRGGWRAFISFTGTVDGFLRMDYRHKEACQAETAGTANEPSRGLLIQTDENTFYIAGQGFRVFLLPELAADDLLTRLTLHRRSIPQTRNMRQYEKGTFPRTARFLSAAAARATNPAMESSRYGTAARLRSECPLYYN